MDYPFTSVTLIPIFGMSFLYWISKCNNLDEGGIIAFIAKIGYYMSLLILKRSAKYSRSSTTACMS